MYLYKINTSFICSDNKPLSIHIMRIFLAYVIILLNCSILVSQNQNLKDNFTYKIRQAEGDINNDDIKDLIVISMDTIHETRPLKLEIFLSQHNGVSKLFFSTTNMIQAMYPKELNGKHNGNQIPNVYIEQGKLQLEFYTKGNALYEFKFKKGVFELIHFTYAKWNGQTITEVAFNLLTGKYTKQSEIHETSKIIEVINGNILINPLPDIKNFKPFNYNLF